MGSGGGEAGYTLCLKLVLIALAYGHRGWKSLATHAHEPTADCHVIATCMNSSQQRPFFTHNVPPPITLCISFPLHLIGLLFFFFFRADSRFFDGIAFNVLAETAFTHTTGFCCPPHSPLCSQVGALWLLLTESLRPRQLRAGMPPPRSPLAVLTLEALCSRWHAKWGQFSQLTLHFTEARNKLALY